MKGWKNLETGAYAALAFVLVILGVGVLARAAETDPEILRREALRKVAGGSGLVLAVDTNAVTDATSVTPAYVGQFLVGSAGTGTNAVWLAKGATTNDWVRIAP